MKDDKIVTPSGISIEYDDEKHAYRVDGERFPSVTTLLGVIDKSPALMAWCERVTCEGVDELLLGDVDRGLGEIGRGELPRVLKEAGLSYRDVRDEAATRGTSVHDALEALAKEGTPPDLTQFPEADRGYVQALCGWWIKHTPVSVMTEQIVASKEHRFAGRFDLLARVGEDLTLIDLKTSKSVYPSMHYQIEAYRLALVECGFPATDKGAILRVGADGEFEYVESRASAQDFLIVASLYESLKRVRRKPKVDKAAA